MTIMRNPHPRAWLAALMAAALLAPAASSAQTHRAGRHVVNIQAFRFAPDTLRVSVGDTVVWSNHDMVPHTATDARKRWDSGNIAAGAVARRVVDRPGTQEYVCAYHPTMRAVLVVRPR